MEALNRHRQARAETAIRFGIGLHIGQVVYGNVGAPDRLDFTVVGAAVNRTARIESLTKEAGFPLLFSAEFAAQIGSPVRSLGKYALRGVADELEIFTLAAGDAPMRAQSGLPGTSPVQRASQVSRQATRWPFRTGNNRAGRRRPGHERSKKIR